MKKKVLLIIALIILLVPAFIFLVPVKDGRTIYKNIKYKQLLAGAIQPDNYDKLKISYARITERKTGTSKFNTADGSSIDDGSVLSDTEGNDVSELDNYIRTYDELIYRIEVGIDRNENTTTDSDNFNSGVIKIRVTIPKNDDGHPWFVVRKESWMANLNRSDDFTSLTANYVIPTDETVVGGNQELTLRFHTQGYTGEIPEDMKPIVEVWMEGNEPDNSSSMIESIYVEDNEDLYITGVQRITTELKRGIINRKSVLDGVTGNYISFGIFARFTRSEMKGFEYPYNGINASLKLEYYYDNLDDDEGWIKLDRANDRDREVLDGIKLVSYGRPYEATPGFWPNENSNTFKGENYYSGAHAELDGYLEDSPYKYDSGTLTASYSEETLTFQNRDNIFNGYRCSGWSQFISDGFEIFVPYFEETGNYAFQIKIISDEITGINYKNEEATFYPNGSMTFDIINSRSGNFTYDIYTYYKNSSSYETETIVMEGSQQYTKSDVSAADGPYEGGEDRLIVWDSAKIYLYETGNKFEYDSGEELPNLSIKYGVYKNNNGILTNDDTINTAVYEDFDWYESISEAKNHGRISGIFIDDRDYRGFGSVASAVLYFKAYTDLNNIRTVAMIKQNIRLYKDEERTDYTSAGYNQTYVKSTCTDTGCPSQQGSPLQIGHSYLIAPLIPSIPFYTYDHTTNQSKNTFNVQEKYIDVKATPRTSASGEIAELTTNFRIVMTISDSAFYYREGSANIEPDRITQSYNGQSLEWNFNSIKPTELPKITFQVEMSPYITNNARGTIYAYIYSPMYPNDYGFFDQTINFVNLAGSSMRENINKDFLNKNEQFEVTNYIYNISDEELTDIKSIEILPKNSDEKGSSFNGNYTIEIMSINDNQKVYYTTSSVDTIEKDADGNYTIKNVDIENDSNWIEANVGDTIPFSATAIATTIPQIPIMQDVSFKYKVIPVDNKQGDIYYFQSFSSSTNLDYSIVSEKSSTTVSTRKISGTVFDDLNRNNMLNGNDAKENNYAVELLDEEETKIDETTTDSNGYYEFSSLEIGKYYIRFASIPNGYELTPKGTDKYYNKANANFVTDILDHTINPHAAIEEYANINLGYRKKPATLIIKYLDKNNDQPLADQVESTVYYTDNYETHGLTTIPENYSFLENAGDPVSDVVNKDEIVVIYYYDYTPATITTKHYIDGTTIKIHEDVIQNKKFTQGYSTEALDTTNLNYEYVRTDGDNTSGTVTKTNIVVNYYYKLKTGTVTTHHYLYDNGDTTTKLAPDVIKEWNYTDTYTTTVSSEVPSNYEFYKKSDNYTSVLGSPIVDVNYYYRLKDSSLTTSINQEATEEITSKDSKVDYTITYNAKVVDYIGDGTITIVDTLPYEIDVDNSNLNGGTYDATNKTITWTVNWSDIDTYNNHDETTITKTISVKYNGIVGRDRIMTNNVTGNIVLSNNSRDAQAQTSTNISIKGNIKVVYIDKDTGEEIETAVEETNLVGEEFISSAIEKDGYKLVTKPDSETFEFEEEDQLITYEYEHIKYEIRAVVQGVGGKISGDEDVYWGEDSTLDNIVIEAEEGYIIEAIYINGVRQELVLGEERVVLSNFINVLENKNIEVVFAKKPQENPNTKASMGWIILVSWLIFFTLVILLKKTKELE